MSTRGDFTSIFDAISTLQCVPIAVQVLLVVAAFPLALYAYDWVRKERPMTEYPLISLDGKTPEQSWIYFPKETLVKGAQLCPDSPFQVASHTGPRLIIPQKYAQEVRVAEDISLVKAFMQDMPLSCPGFDMFRLSSNHDRLLATVARTKLSPSLNTFTPAIVEETLAVTHDLFDKQIKGDDWQKVLIHDAAWGIVTPVTLRILVGEKRCRDPELINIYMKHAEAALKASTEVRAYPTALWPIVHWFLPLPQQLRKQLKRAEEILGQDVRQRQKEAMAILASEQQLPKPGDSVTWFAEVTKSLGIKKYDPIVGQLGFASLALHNVSIQTAAVMWYLCEYPEWIDILRQEVISVITETGWTRQSLAKMDLVDAFHRETQTYVRGTLAIIRRYPERDLKFHDGLTIPKGRRFFLMPQIPIDKQGEFDPYRWIKMRETSADPKSLLFTATNVENQVFGLGKYACPGRFFAHDELKIVTAILLLKYDWRKLPTTPKPFFKASEDVAIFPRGVELQLKARVPEVPIS